MNTLKFDELPSVIATLTNEFKELKALLLQKAKTITEIEKPKNIDEAVNITGFSKPTIYLYCQKNTIPHHKKNGRLFFFESELIDWIKEGKQKTVKEIETDTDALLSNKNKAM